MIISEDKKAIAGAFIKARGAMNATVAKDAKGNFGKYATLAAIVEATTEAFVANGLAIVQEVSTDEHGVTVETWLVHESGATMEFKSLTLPLSQRTPQAVGSAITYGRRYALAAICGLAPDDDDGQAAQDASKTPQRAAEPRKEKKTPDTAMMPTDAELDVLGTWTTPQDAQVWAVANGACKNEFEAKQSFKKIVDEYGGRLTKENVAAVYLAVLRKWIAKAQAAPAQEAQAA